MPTPNTADAMRRYKAGKAGFTDKAHLKAKGLIPRADGTKRKSDKYEELDKGDTAQVKTVIKGLKKASGLHAKQAKSLEKQIDDDLDRQPQDKDVKKVKGTQPKKYYKTLDKDTKKKRAAFFKKKAGTYKKSDGNKDYKPAPGDAKAKTKTSTHTKKYKQMYGEDAPANATGTAVVGTGDDSSTVVVKKKDKETMKDRLLKRFKIKETIDRTIPDIEVPEDEIKEKVKHLKAMAMQEADLDEAIKGLQNKAKKTGMPYSILKKVYDRGMAAWKGGHRPGATQQQWAFARVNSFVTKSSGTWGGADKDLAKKVRGSK
tara:strand:- start:1419 stop:2366 length:948 start_codon:yes stop_codon:yes gene_type:complete